MIGYFLKQSKPIGDTGLRPLSCIPLLFAVCHQLPSDTHGQGALLIDRPSMKRLDVGHSRTVCDHTCAQTERFNFLQIPSIGLSALLLRFTDLKKLKPVGIADLSA
jgi:hypothetical protein